MLENYEGSVYLVWGLQDWNVDPYHAFPTYQLLRDAGINARAIAGQWAHNYPTNRIDTVHFQVVMEPKHIQTCLEWIGLLSYTIGLDIT